MPKSAAWPALARGSDTASIDDCRTDGLLVRLKPVGSHMQAWLRHHSAAIRLLIVSIVVTSAAVAAEAVTSKRDDSFDAEVQRALVRAGENREEIQQALARVKPAQRDGMRFLIAHMPPRDLRSLSGAFLLENVDYAYRAWEESAWRDSIPKPIFLNDVLPYASVSERRDNWRKAFYERFRPLVADAASPGEAAVILNQKVFALLNVRYSTKRRRPDQSPFESMELGLASCTGLSIVLIDACRAVGVPARLAGTPLWSDRSGNHSWVEVWDDGWHFTGAAEPAGNDLDKAWFVGRASRARRHHKYHAIYAVSYRKTPLPFPMVWAGGADYVSAVNVTDRYVHAAGKPPEGWTCVMFRAAHPDGTRCRAALRILDAAGKVVFNDHTNDERFDRNDHRTAELEIGKAYEVEFTTAGHRVTRTIRATGDDQLVSVEIPGAEQPMPSTAIQQATELTP